MLCDIQYLVYMVMFMLQIDTFWAKFRRENGSIYLGCREVAWGYLGSFAKATNACIFGSRFCLQHGAMKCFSLPVCCTYLQCHAILTKYPRLTTNVVIGANADVRFLAVLTQSQVGRAGAESAIQYGILGI